MLKLPQESIAASTDDQSLRVNLTDLLLDYDSWDELARHFSGFNIFEAIGHVRAEERHSNFLGFLLDPEAEHGLGADFLTRFLQEVLQQVGADARPIDLVELSLLNLDSTLVLRENNNIDILGINEREKVLIVIENKIASTEHTQQLQRYRKFAEANYPEYRHIFIYLTVDGAEPSDSSYIAFSYSEIDALLSELLRRKKSALPSESCMAIEHYQKMLRRHVVPNDELISLARAIYHKHKSALDFIFEQRPDLQSELSEYLAGLVQQESSFELDRKVKSYIDFAPRSWRDIAKFNAAEPSQWTKSGRSLMFEFRNNASAVSLALVLGPGDSELRGEIFDFCKSNASVYKGGSKTLYASYTTLHSRKILSKQQLEDANLDDLTDAIQRYWRQFLEKEMKQVCDPLEAAFAK